MFKVQEEQDSLSRLLRASDPQHGGVNGAGGPKVTASEVLPPPPWPWGLQGRRQGGFWTFAGEEGTDFTPLTVVRPEKS